MQDPHASTGMDTGHVGDTASNSGNMSASGRYADSMEHDRSSLGDKVRGIASQAQEKTGAQVRSSVDAGKTRAASALHGVAQSLLGGAQDQEDGLGGYIRQAGEQVRRAADFLENTDARELTRRTEEYARRQPALFLGGAFALGLIAARFLKSSHRHASTGSSSDVEDMYGRSGGARRARAGRYSSGVDDASRFDSQIPVASYRDPMPSYPAGVVDGTTGSTGGTISLRGTESSSGGGVQP
ncbi:hypothetical protein [Gemmatimonas sp.]|uniref:hypothetical protein n=1 Tax=Gemmatimonas sp. TaxID=1962908 RepID=UPI00398355B2